MLAICYRPIFPIATFTLFETDSSYGQVPWHHSSALPTSTDRSGIMPDGEGERSCVDYLTAIVHMRSLRIGDRDGVKPLSRDAGLNVIVQEWEGMGGIIDAV